MIIGEAPGAEEERLGAPFMGAAGMELNRMLGEAGLNRSDAFVTYLCRVRPLNNDITAFIPATKKDLTSAHIPLLDRRVMPCIVEGYNLLMKEIELCKPRVIIALGNAAQWALTQRWGAKHWRGSQLFTDSGIPVIPTYAPAMVLRQWSLRTIVVHDMRRAALIVRDGPVPEPVRRYTIRPSYDAVIEALGNLRGLCERTPAGFILSLDIETAGGHIVCLGIGWSRADAICIPFSTGAGMVHHWTLEDEAQIVHALYRLLTHTNARIIWQNGLFDAQYIFRHWHFLPRHHCDTMIGHHTCFSTTQKSLDFLASMYNEHYVQWKGISRELHSPKKDD